MVKVRGTSNLLLHWATFYLKMTFCVWIKHMKPDLSGVYYNDQSYSWPIRLHQSLTKLRCWFDWQGCNQSDFSSSASVSLIQKRWGVAFFLVHKVNRSSITSDCLLPLYHKNIYIKKKRNESKTIGNDILNKYKYSFCKEKKKKQSHTLVKTDKPCYRLGFGKDV